MSDAEALLELGELLLKPRRAIIATEGMDAIATANAIVAVKLYRADTVLKFRAITEDWDRVKIVEAL